MTKEQKDQIGEIWGDEVKCMFNKFVINIAIPSISCPGWFNHINFYPDIKTYKVIDMQINVVINEKIQKTMKALEWI